MTMETILCIATLFIIEYGTFVLGDYGCQTMEEAEVCVWQVNSGLNTTVVGVLGPTNRQTICRSHQRAVGCLRGLEEGCREDADYLESRIEALRLGLGQFCQSHKAFSSYRKYAPCYRKSARNTLGCLDQFNVDVADVMDTDGDICMAIEALLRCTNVVIKKRCPGGAFILEDLMLAQVPNQELCTSLPRSEPTSNTSPPALARYTWIILVTAFVTYRSALL